MSLKKQRKAALGKLLGAETVTENGFLQVNGVQVDPLRFQIHCDGFTLHRAASLAEALTYAKSTDFVTRRKEQQRTAAEERGKQERKQERSLKQLKQEREADRQAAMEARQLWWLTAIESGHAIKRVDARTQLESNGFAEREVRLGLGALDSHKHGSRVWVRRSDVDGLLTKLMDLRDNCISRQELLSRGVKRSQIDKLDPDYVERVAGGRYDSVRYHYRKDRVAPMLSQ